MQREVRVGALVLAALAVFATGIFLIGERNNLFRRTARYSIQFTNVDGLMPGNPVQLNGVNVGTVDDVVLPESPDEESLRVEITIDRRYRERVREDSMARIKTLGLLGDKYVQLTSGSPGEPIIPPGGEIPAAPATDVDKLIASSGDVVDNIVAVSVSLRNLLTRMERGEGLLGALAVETEAGREAKSALLDSLEAIRSIAERIERGEGSLGRLLHEDRLVVSLEESLGRLEEFLDRASSGDGLFPALLSEPEMRQRFETTLANLDEAAARFSAVAVELEEGDGLAARLLTDEELADRFEEELTGLLSTLRSVAEKLDRGEGTAGKLVNDPEIHQAVEDIIVGVEESAILRWLIRNRQKKGIEERYDEAREEEEEEGGGR